MRKKRKELRKMNEIRGKGSKKKTKYGQQTNEAARNRKKSIKIINADYVIVTSN